MGGWEFPGFQESLQCSDWTKVMVGSCTAWWDLLSCNVLVHLIMRWAPGGAKITSCLRKCLSASNCAVLWGVTLDIWRKA